MAYYIHQFSDNVTSNWPVSVPITHILSKAKQNLNLTLGANTQKNKFLYWLSEDKVPPPSLPERP